MNRVYLLLFLIALGLSAQAQFSLTLGLYSGVTTAYTNDDGIKKDPRYEGRFEVKMAPFGVYFGIDYEKFGFVVSPGLINIGQNYYLVNTSGGQDGLRKIDLRYVVVPLALKIHLVDFSAFKFSALASISPAFLLQGKDELSHQATKLEFPSAEYPILPPDYTIEYDGVLTPEVNNRVLGEKSDFRSLQLFVGAGFRSDWDPTDHWRISVDLRVNYGIFDPRTKAFTDHKETTQSLYEIPGERKDMFAQFTVGIARYIDFEKADQDPKKRFKKSSKKYKPSQYPGRRIRHAKPKE